MKPRWIFGMSLYAVGMSMFFAHAATLTEPGGPAIPVALACLTVGMLGSMVYLVVSGQEKRLSRLEELQRKAEQGLGETKGAKKSGRASPE